MGRPSVNNTPYFVHTDKNKHEHAQAPKQRLFNWVCKKLYFKVQGLPPINPSSSQERNIQEDKYKFLTKSKKPDSTKNGRALNSIHIKTIG